MQILRVTLKKTINSSEKTNFATNHLIKDMSFEKIISIPGLSGLFKMVAQMRNGGFVVESLIDSRRVPVSATQRIVMLKDISIYTTGDDMPLYEVFKKMKEMDAVSSSITPKADSSELKSTLKKVLPEFDDARVHVSDIRKMFTWYSALKEVIGSEESEAAMKNEENVSDSATLPEAEVAVTESVKKKAPAKKKKTEETTDATEVAAPETPKKKAAKKTTKAVE